MFGIFLAVLLVAEPELAPKPRIVSANSDVPAEFVRGRAMIEGYFRAQVRAISAAELTSDIDRAAWENDRPKRRRQLLDMLGLWPMPARTELKPTITGTTAMNGYVIENLHFQSRPNLYVTANLYIPTPRPKNAPTILYVCGHGNIVKDGVSYGSKTFYQRHAAWYASHGYVCMVLDTLQLSEIPGLHHGTHHLGMWWWQTRGYTPAGIETWNGIRALDYLETRPEVDAKRIGLTGRSGGGATSWYIAAADDRPACVIPVAGIADLESHICEGYPGRLQGGVIAGHCDCMFPVNTYRWDFASVAALIAPRPLMLGNSDVDDLFPVPGYRRIAAKVHRVYNLYGKADRFTVLETKGSHVDSPELRTGSFRWMNRWLKNDDAIVNDEPFEPLPVEKLKVLTVAPEGNVNARIHETGILPTTFDVPQTTAVAKAWWEGQASLLRQALREKVFAGWPSSPAKLGVRAAGDVTFEGVRLQAFDFTSETEIDLRLWIMSSAKVERPTLAVLNVLNDADFAEWCDDLGPQFSELLQRPTTQRNDAAFARNRRVMETQKWAFAAVCPRGIGPTRWAKPGSPDETHFRRRFPLIGQTLEGMQVWDVRRALAALQEVRGDAETPTWLQAKRDMAGIALYAGLFEPSVKRLDLWHLPATHDDGPTFLNVRRVLDLPQAVALATMPVKLYVKDAAEAKRWEGLPETVKVRVVGE